MVELPPDPPPHAPINALAAPISKILDVLVNISLTPLVLKGH
jgi:hypothetical protein